MSCVVFFDYLNCFPQDVVWRNRILIHWVPQREAFEPVFAALPEPGQSAWQESDVAAFAAHVQPTFEVEFVPHAAQTELRLTHGKSRDQMRVRVLNVERNLQGVVWVFGAQRASARAVRMRKLGSLKLVCPARFLKSKRPFT